MAQHELSSQLLSEDSGAATAEADNQILFVYGSRAHNSENAVSLPELIIVQMAADQKPRFPT